MNFEIEISRNDNFNWHFFAYARFLISKDPMQLERSTLFGKSQIIMWDTTSHGGVVISASKTNNWYGKGVVRKGDTVYCPQCPPHFFEVTEGLENCTDTNARLPLATEGHLTSCGATLMARQAPLDLKIAAIEEKGERPVDHGFIFDLLFLVKDANTGKPISNLPYRITLANGEQAKGITDSNGQTNKIYSDTATTATLEAPYYGDPIDTNCNTHSSFEHDACRC